MKKAEITVCDFQSQALRGLKAAASPYLGATLRPPCEEASPAHWMMEGDLKQLSPQPAPTARCVSEVIRNIPEASSVLGAIFTL